jgi:hypothetical protein
MGSTVPLISSAVSGPAGVIHLPRLWQKLLLSAKGELSDEYDECGKGFDQMTLDGLGLDRDATIKYVKGNLPTYPQFESWVIQQKGGRLDSAQVQAVNDSIRAYNHGDATRQGILSAAGIPDTGTIKDAVMLNQLEDWTEFHAALTKA